MASTSTNEVVSPSIALRPAIRVAIAAIVIAGVLLLLIQASGSGAGEAISALIRGSVGTKRTFGESLLRTTPILIVGIGLIPSLRIGLYNIGSPGQMAVGALAATLISTELSGLPGWLLLPLAAIGAATGGAVAAYGPAILRARWDVNEIISTLVFNFIIANILGYLLNGPLQGQHANLPQSEILPSHAQIPNLIPGTRAHLGLVIALATVPLLMAYQASRGGYRLRLFGANERLARQAGSNPTKVVVSVMCLGGAAAGLAGWMQVAAVDRRLYTTVSSSVGFDGFFAALLGGLHPLGVVVSSFGLGALRQGAGALQVGADISPEIIQVFIGLVILVYATRAMITGKDVPK